MIIGFAADGGIDASARTLNRRLSERFVQPIVIDTVLAQAARSASRWGGPRWTRLPGSS